MAKEEKGASDLVGAFSAETGALGFTELRSTVIAARIAVAGSAIYLLQYLILGSDAGSAFDHWYILIFSLMFLSSTAYLLLAARKTAVREVYARVYAGILILWGACLTSLDLQINLDLSAYGVTLVGACAFLGAPVSFYVPLVLVSSGVVLGSFVLSPRGDAFVDGFVPIVSFALIGLGLASMRWRERKELLGAWKEVAVRTARLEELSFKDHLTGLYNRRFFVESLGIARKEALRDASPLSVSILDIDHFKKVNDSKGHAVGDLVLQDFARRVEKEKRSSDLCARYGGEEFVLLFRATSLEVAVSCVDRVRQGLVGREFPELGGTLSFSAGVAEFDGRESIEDLLRRADAALYRAKVAGRNRVMSDKT